MRVLHTSDWHLGKRLEQFSRLDEQRRVLREITDIADEKNVDLVLITGDLFDSYNPPVEAEELFYSTLKKLSAGGSRPVVAIAGNHDSADAVQAPDPLARLHGIVLLGYPGISMPELTSEGGVVMSFPAPGLLEILLPPEKEVPPVRILTAPYANEKRLRGLFRRLDEAAVPEDSPGDSSDSGDPGDPLDDPGDDLTEVPEEEALPAIPDSGEVMERLFEYWRKTGEEHFSRETINIIVAHLFCIPAADRSGDSPAAGPESALVIDGSAEPEPAVELEEPEDEKPILYPGGLAPVSSDAFPPMSQYVALGHLHRPQDVTRDPFPVSYCGSPLAYSRSEAAQQKYVYCVNIEAGRKAVIEKIPLSAGRRILKHRSDSVEEAISWLQEHRDSYVELTLETDSFLSSVDRQRIYGAHPQILSVIPELTGELRTGVDTPVDTEKPITELFGEYFSAEHEGADPPQELLDLFREVLARPDQPDSTDKPDSRDRQGSPEQQDLQDSRDRQGSPEQSDQQGSGDRQDAKEPAE